MERIKKALERAREQQAKQPPAGSPLKTRQEAAQPQSPATPPEPRMPESEAVAAVVESTAPIEEVVETAHSDARVQEAPKEKAGSFDKVKLQEKRSKETASHLQSRVPSDIEYSQTRRIEISADQLAANRVVAGIKDHPQSDLFRVLRTKILHRMRIDKINSLAVTSPTKGAGKSMVASNLAVSLAMEANQTVMLVDLDLRKPAISKYFGLDAQQGVGDYLLEGTELPGLLVHPGIDRLIILPAGNPVPQSSELLSTPRMAHLVEEITNRYATRIIVFDLPPLLHLDDALIFLPQVKSSLLVIEEGVNTPAEIEQSLMLLEKSNMLGTVYNKARLTKHLPY